MILFLLVINLLVIFFAQKYFAKNAENKIAELNSRLENIMRDEFRDSRKENLQSARNDREEIGNNLKNLSELLSNNVANLSNIIENRLQLLQKENATKLDEMRVIVDEKLHATVEKRFNESFKLIGHQLEQVYKGLGEMQGLASNVGDLKKVLSNVKIRGVIGEFQLAALLEQFLSPAQYQHNACVKPQSQERVEFAINLPSKNDDAEFLLLPIDSKFPNEDYQRLVELYEKIGEVDARQIEIANRQFENAVKKNAKEIFEKYINPPTTTDFALMFVPTEGLYAEIIKRSSLFETLQREFKVIVVGPTNLAAFISALQIAFKTLSVEKRASEIWRILGEVKSEFGKFGDALDLAKKKIEQAAKSIDEAGVRTRAVERKLKSVEEMPSGKQNLLDNLEEILPVAIANDEE